MSISRRTLLAALPATLTALGLARGAYAMQVGNILVEPLLDGPFPLTLDMIPDAKNEDGQKLLTAAGKPAEGPDTIPVNGFVIRRGTGITLIDSGAGGLFGPDLGKLPGRLDSMGIEASKVGMVVLTHLHPDHAGGVLLPDGKPRFPNATLAMQADEAAFWSSNENMSKAGEEGAPFFNGARAALAAYKGRWRMLYGQAAISPGLTAMPLPGHTPGHQGIMIADGKDSLLVWGDIIHSAALQLARPEWSVVFDTDQAMAAATRKRVLDMVVTDKVRVAGSHMAMQGRIEKRGTGYAMVA